MIPDPRAWEIRAGEILAIQNTSGADSEAVQFAISMLIALRHAQGAIKNALKDLDAGLVVNLRVAVAGEVLAELVRVGKDILKEKTEEAKNVGAVLIAAAYDGILRKMAEEFASLTDRPDLQDVIAALKNAGVLKGASVSVAQGYLKFRNNSLHADWKNVERSEVLSCLSFVESLLERHFS